MHHRPENCYPGQGFDLLGKPLRRQLKTGEGSPEAELWTARFAKPEVTTGGDQLHIFWAWNAAGVEGSGVSALDFRIATVSLQAVRGPRLYR